MISVLDRLKWERLKKLLLLLSLLCWAHLSFAFRVSPMVVVFTSTGSGSTQNFLLENTGHGKIAVQIEAFHRFVDVDGKETRTPTDEFSVYPQQLSLQPNEKRSVRVTWTGNHLLDQELSYRLVVSELSVEAKDSEKATTPSPGPTFLMQYVASLYVGDSKFSPKVEVTSFHVLSDLRGELTLKNAGLAHQVLKGIRLFFKTPDGNRVELKSQDTEALQGENLLANASRRFSLLVPPAVIRAEKAKPGSVRVEVQF